MAYAGRQIAGAESWYNYKVEWQYGLPNMFAISPFGSGANDYIQAIGNKPIESDKALFLAKGIVARNNVKNTDSDITTPISLKNATDERILCALSWKDNKVPGQAAGETPEIALANFYDLTGGDGDNMLYIPVPLAKGDGIVVTYKINGQPKQIITSAKTAQHANFIENLTNTNVFSLDNSSTFVKVGSEALACNSMSAPPKDITKATKNDIYTAMKQSVLVIDRFSTFFKDKYKFVNGTGQGTFGYFGDDMLAYGENLVTLRLNAEKLGWLKSNVSYIDVDITVIKSNFGYRQITFPYRFLVEAEQ